jgi:hypothetical protein
VEFDNLQTNALQESIIPGRARGACVADLFFRVRRSANRRTRRRRRRNVEDETGAVLPGARVTLLRDETSPSLQETVTDAAGAFRFERVPPGAYVIRTEFRAFKPGSARVRVSSSAPSKRPSR